MFEYLKARCMIGQIDPWRATDDGEPIMALLVPVETALHEYTQDTERKLTRVEFLKELKDSNVFVFRNIDEFVKLKENLRKTKKETKVYKKGFKRTLTDERKKALQVHASQIRDKTKGSIPKKA